MRKVGSGSRLVGYGVAAFAIASVLLCARPALAQDEPAPPPSTPTTDRPWAAGVSAEDQAKAKALYDEGNALFVEAQYSQALAKYKEAIHYWDAPGIRYNMAKSEFELGEQLAAYDDYTRALAYGRAALEDREYQEALAKQQALHGQLGEITVACDEPGAEVMLDSEKLFTAPGESHKLLVPGNHQVVASKRAYLTVGKTVTLLPGQPTVERVKLVPLASLSTTRRRWAPWKPWVVAGAGAGVALLGVPLYYLAKSDFDSHDQTVARLCMKGCNPDPVADTKSRARVENVMAVSAFAVGATAAVTGVVLLLMNQPHTVQARDPAVAIEPAATGEGALVTVRLSY